MHKDDEASIQEAIDNLKFIARSHPERAVQVTAVLSELAQIARNCDAE